MYIISRIFSPEIYQGKFKHHNYFEGWYYKLIDRNSSNILAIIPGVSITNNYKHSFIQINNAKTLKTNYINFGIEDFSYSDKDFIISIGDSHFNRDGLSVNINSDEISIHGKINFKNILPFPKSLINPGIMGPFSFIPFMECYHGIVNIHCDLEGALTINDKQVEFNGGYGYVEKDWGSSFPKSWIWIQTNHFDTENTVLMFSIASIPLFNTQFDGMIAFLMIGGRMYRFATYTRAKVKKLDFHNNVLDIIIEDSKYVLVLKAENSEGGMLKAPHKGNMDVELNESITAVVNVTLYDKNGRIIFEGVGKNTGLELAGDFRSFLTRQN